MKVGRNGRNRCKKPFHEYDRRLPRYVGNGTYDLDGTYDIERGMLLARAAARTVGVEND